MAATVQTISIHGATVTTTETVVADASTIRFKRADNDTQNTSDPIPKPSGAANYSWRKSFRPKVTVTPSGDISNYRFFTDAGSWGTGCTLFAHSKPVANYDQASSGDNTTKIVADGGSAVTDASTFTSVSPLVVNSGVVLTNPATNYGTCDLTELQLEVANTAALGLKGPRTVTFRHDET